MATTYVYEMDTFRIERNGSNILVDHFNDGVSPPSINNEGGGTGITYNAFGIFSEANGVLVMDSALAESTTIGGETARVMNVTALTNNQNEQNGLGLKINDDFGVYGRFNLILPQEERSEYGIRFSDFNSPPGGPVTGGDDVIALSVRMGTDGVVRVVLSDRNLTDGTMEILGTVELTPALLGTADQIGLGLLHHPDNPGEITARYRLYENGVELPGGPYPVPGFGRIFGTDTATTVDNEVWTRAQFFSTGIDPAAPEIEVIGAGSQVIADNDTTPSSADGTAFGSVNLGASLTQIFTINNLGGQPLEVSNFKVPAGFTIVSPPPGTIPGGASATFEVAVNSSTVGTKSGQITFTTNDTTDGENAYNFAISANVVAATPEILLTGNGQDIVDGDLTPDAVNDTAFGDVLLGAAASRTFTIDNTGNGTLTISKLKMPAGFTLVGTAPTSILPGDSATIEVQIVGAKLGLNTGQITFTTNDMTGGENAYNFAIAANVIAPEIAVTGTGTKPNQNINDNDTSPSLIDGTDFGGVALNLDGTERTFTVKNDGTADLVISDLLVSGGFVLIDDLDDDTIEAGTSDTFTVKLDTSTPGSQAGQITFTTNDLTGGENAFNFAIKGNVTITPEIAVSGNGLDITINDLTPDVADDTHFGTANLLSSDPNLEHTFTVTNTGSAPLTVTGLKLPKGFILVEGLSGPIAQNGGTDTFTVRLDTSKAGTFSGPISFATNDPDEKAFKFQVTGVVVQPEIDVVGNNVSIKDNSKKGAVANHTDFGPGIGLDDVSPTRTFTIHNTGVGDLVISSMAVEGTAFNLLDDLTGITIAGGASETFEIELDTSTAGLKTGKVIINNNDANEAVYDFAISAAVGPRNVPGSDAVDDEFVGTVDPESFNGMLGSDTVSYAGAAAVTASLLSPKANTDSAAGDLYTSIENLIGTDFNDKLTGNAGNNVLEGGAGADTLDGGAGIDTASYANAAGGVAANLLKAANNLGEAAGDTYKNIENLLGSAFGDTLIGNNSNNDINGGDGDDIITGGLGRDNLTGGLGVDHFKFGLATEGGDTVTDFAVAEDKIVIDKSGFKIDADVDIGAADQFDFALHYFVSAVGAPATSANPSGVMATELGHGQFLFNETDSKLWWDADGLGKGKAVLIADLQDGVMLTANHFILDA